MLVFNKIKGFLRENGIVMVPLFGLIFVTIILIVILSGNGKSGENNPTVRAPLPIPTDYTKDYSNLHLLIPGKSSSEDVKRINGNPTRISTFGNKTYFYYSTPLKGFENVVLLIENRVFYAREYVFGSYRGSLTDFQKIYGNTFIKMYEDEEPFVWFIYVNKGIGIEANAKNEIGTLIYFVPMSESDFIKKLASEFNITTTPSVINE